MNEASRNGSKKSLERTWCNVCAYPPCSAGCGQPRPKKATYHAKLVGQELWTCGACAQKPCVQCGKDVDATAKAHAWCLDCAYPSCQSCGAPRPRATSYHVKVKPQWTCQNCIVKPCAQCGTPLEPQAEANTLCSACSYPPCQTCGRPRPRQSGYHVKDLPTWTCPACVKQCAQCGLPLESKAEVKTLCPRCRYPPCQSCGLKETYHVERLPQWTCADCAAKTCAQCGQLLGARARGGAICVNCAFPPCASCGRARPQTGAFHASVLPTWTCAECSAGTRGGVPKKKRRKG